jgi:hypothetical protein
MLIGPKIKLAVDLHRMARFFPLGDAVEGGWDYDMVVERERCDAITALLRNYKIDEDRIIREFCFILLWIEKETHEGEDQPHFPGKYYRMRTELDNLKQYLMNHRITSVVFRGEYEKNKPGGEFIMEEEVNIDRLCDGIRTVFREEFSQDLQKRKSKGLTNWKRRKMFRLRNNILNYFTVIPEIDELSLEEQNELIDQIAVMAGITGL